MRANPLHSRNAILLPGLLILTLLARGDAEVPLADPILHRITLAQGRVDRDALQIQSEVSQVIAEINLNGLDQMDSATPIEVATRLGDLSQNTFTPLTRDLQASALDPAVRPAALLEIVRRQMAAELRLKNISVQLAPRVAQTRMIHHIVLLLAHQIANLRHTTDLLPGPAAWSPRRQMLHQVDGIRQGSIQSEIVLLSQTPANLPNDPFNFIAGDLLKKMDDVLLLDKADRATLATLNGTIPEAVTAQTILRDALRKLLDEARDKSGGSIMLEGGKALGQMPGQQRSLDKTLQPGDQVGVQPSSGQPGSDPGNQPGGVSVEVELSLADEAALAAGLIKGFNPAAAGYIEQAQQGMGNLAGQIGRGADPGDLAGGEAQILHDLAEAQRLLAGEPGPQPGVHPDPNGDQLAAAEQPGTIPGLGQGEGPGEGSGNGPGEGEGEGAGQSQNQDDGSGPGAGKGKGKGDHGKDPSSDNSPSDNPDDPGADDGNGPGTQGEDGHGSSEPDPDPHNGTAPDPGGHPAQNDAAGGQGVDRHNLGSGWAGVVVGDLTPRERAAISQYQEEKTPAEYAALVRQYQQNLSEPDASP